MDTQQRIKAELIGDCVHCGFCLPACPTYRSWGLEADSPRGRIDLMKGLGEGAIDLTPAVMEHFDACLGCMGCVTACPSGVRYDLLIESTRAEIEARGPRDLADRAFRELIFAMFPHPKRLAILAPLLYLYEKSGLRKALAALGFQAALPPRLRALDELLPPLTLAQLRARLPERVPAGGERRGSVALIAGCVQRVFFPNVNGATVRVLAAEGYDVVIPANQGCCGALSLHAGRAPEAHAFARALIDRFVPPGTTHPTVDAIIINAAGCGSTLKEYGLLLRDEPQYAQRAAAFAERVRDVNEFLAGVEPRAPRAPAPLRVAYHDACHLAHAQRVREAPRALLRSIPDLELVEIADGDQCCGSAGVYNLLEPEAAWEIGERKAERILATGAAILASANPGCTLQLRSHFAGRGRDLTAAHPIELLDAAIARANVRTIDSFM